MALKADPSDQALLLELQEHDTRLTQLDHRAKNLPEHVTFDGLTRSADVVRSALAERRNALEDIDLELGRVESDVRVVEERIARDADRLQSSSSVKDVAALEQELAALRTRLADLEEIELAVMERQEEARGLVAASSAELESVLAAVDEAESARDTALAELERERRSTAEERAAIAARVPAELLALYEKQRSRYGVGASLLQHGMSTASGVALQADELATVRAAAPDDVLLCPSSDAILVRTAESGL